ncbi:MAG TPA: 30S ribosome-binding factor RbfA [Saprospiraceae bacterium]|jgi:ribosome-binding factor A|nr:30S ribosome-binding factor RbfA [Saprospiraceae bacterium]HRO07431.1 30S ribosome-binding factor RbfA [Saprospiraceae bacterium]HRO73327.1 30S ribosome-binding factor RbfA [Saprospiraceae bacterium]HRP40714.1 30S ribosome-binding factor RbfA [Saprospiraceae bacterium]
MDSKRQLQIGELIKRSFAPILQEHGRYIYGDAFVSVTTVKVAPDLSQAKIYVSIFNTNDKEGVLKSISNHTHLLKQALVQRIKSQVRRIPVVHFYSDETIDEMFKIDAMFENVKKMYPPSVQEEE